jgi:hypothetical protein
VELNHVKTVEDVKVLGSVQEVALKIEEVINPLKISANSYEELLEILLLLQKKWVEFIDSPFVSDEKKYIFLLTEVDGEKRNEKLGITDDLYENPELAKKWFQSVRAKVHPDKCPDKSGKAFQILKDIYNVLIDNREGDADE